MPESDPEKRRHEANEGNRASRRSWVHSHTDSPRTQMTDVVIRFSQQQQQHLHPPSPSVRHPFRDTYSNIRHCCHLASAEPTAAAFEGRRHRRRSIALSRSFLRPPSKLRESPSSLPLLFNSHRTLEEVTRDAEME